MLIERRLSLTEAATAQLVEVGRPLVEVGSERGVPAERLVEVRAWLVEGASDFFRQQSGTNGPPGRAATARHILRAVTGADELVEGLAAPTGVESGAPLHTVEVLLAVARVLVVPHSLVIVHGVARQWAGEAEEPFSVTVGDLIRPVTLQGGLIERQTLGTVRYKSGPVGTVQILAALVLVAHLVKAELVGALVGGIGWLSAISAFTVHLHRILAGVGSKRSFGVEQQTFGTELLLAYTVLTLNVGVALLREGVAAVTLWTWHVRDWEILWWLWC